MNRDERSLSRALVSATVASLIATAGWSQTLTWLGTLGGNASIAFGVSADGSVVVGWAKNAAGQARAFRWQNGVMQDLGTLPGGDGIAYAVSADGSVVVGAARNALEEARRAFRWTQATGMVDLGTPSGAGSEAVGVSSDGSVVVGWAGSRAFRWTQATGMQDLGTLGGAGSAAYGVSSDGSVVVGTAQNALGQSRAFRWQNGVMQDLGMPDGRDSRAWGVSADGSVVVGQVNIAWQQARASRWANGVMQNLGALPEYDNSSGALGVSGDGSVVVGSSCRVFWQARCHAFRWTAAGGMEDLNRTYAHLLTSRSYLISAVAISPDGRYIVGEGYNAATNRNEAFLLETGTRCASHNGDVDNNGCVDDADLLAVLFAFGNTGSNLGRVDVNCDQTVDDADLLQVLFNFGSGC